MLKNYHTLKYKLYQKFGGVFYFVNFSFLKLLSLFKKLKLFTKTVYKHIIDKVNSKNLIFFIVFSLKIIVL